jgi:hypothetical protein
MATPAPAGAKEEVVYINVDKRLALIRIAAKDAEKNDANMPKNLHNGAELFLRVGMMENLERLRETTAKMLDMYADNPDGRTGILIGRGCVCWSCGHCGLPKPDMDGLRPGDANVKSPPGPCGNCGETDQINWLGVIQKQLDGKKSTDLPWIEAAPLTEAEAEQKKKADVFAKRAEIEANVKLALSRREASEDSATSL